MTGIFPHSEKEIITAIRIYRSPRIGPSNFASLTKQSENFDDAWDRLCKAYETHKISLDDLCPLDKAREEFDAGMQFGATILFQCHTHYPKALIETDVAPPFLWGKGNLELLDKPNIAVIGARNCSIEGLRTARHYANELSKNGIVITSGLARGIDAAAHEGACADGTIGVIAGGLDIFYPHQNKALQEQMFERGLVISEMPFGHKPQAKNFPQRNRIIAGIASATLVIEATERSGTTITADKALEFGREVMAIPGHPFEARSAGPNKLIQNGARLITTPQQILDYFGMGKATVPSYLKKRPETSLNKGKHTSFANQGFDEIEGKRIRNYADETARI